MKNFIPKPYENQSITIRIHTEKLKSIDRLATQNNISRSKFMNQCIDYALENLNLQASPSKVSTDEILEE